VPLLLERYDAEARARIVFAERHRRSESIRFRVGYFLYRQLHWLVTGIPVRVGNFSAIPRSLLGRLVVVSELWNHYAAAVFRSRLPFSCVPTVRAHRLEGKSSMNTTALVMHGLSAMAVHSEVIGVRLLLATLAFGMLSSLGVGIVIWIRLFTPLAIPGWATNAIGILVLMVMGALLLTLLFSFGALAGRQSANFIPERDHRWFVNEAVDLYPIDG
jgi:hypothetical protein